MSGRSKPKTEDFDLVGDPSKERKDRRGAAKGCYGQTPYLWDETTACLVSLWGSMGITQVNMAEMIGISQDTLTRNYAAELADGGQRAVGRVSRSLFAKAMAGDVTCMIFYLKTRGKWSEKPALGDKDNPIVIEGRNWAPAEVATSLARSLRASKASPDLSDTQH